MKKLLLLLIAVTAFSCSSDDPTPMATNIEDDVTIVFQEKYCPDGDCKINYKVTNSTGKWINFKVKFIFDRVDSNYGSNEYVKEMASIESESYIVQLDIDGQTNHVSAEVYDVQIMQ